MPPSSLAPSRSGGHRRSRGTQLPHPRRPVPSPRHRRCATTRPPARLEGHGRHPGRVDHPTPRTVRHAQRPRRSIHVPLPQTAPRRPRHDGPIHRRRRRRIGRHPVQRSPPALNGRLADCGFGLDSLDKLGDFHHHAGHAQSVWSTLPQAAPYRRCLGDAGDRRVGGSVGDHRATDRHGGARHRRTAGGRFGRAAPEPNTRWTWAVRLRSCSRRLGGGHLTRSGGVLRGGDRR